MGLGTGVSPTVHALRASGQARPAVERGAALAPDQVPVTAAQPSTRPSFSKRPATASKSAPATRTAPLHTGLTRRSRLSGAAIGRAGSNQSPRSFRTSRPIAATRSPARTTTRTKTSMRPGNHAEPDTGTGVQNAPFCTPPCTPWLRSWACPPCSAPRARPGTWQAFSLLGAAIPLTFQRLSQNAARPARRNTRSDPKSHAGLAVTSG